MCGRTLINGLALALLYRSPNQYIKYSRFSANIKLFLPKDLLLSQISLRIMDMRIKQVNTLFGKYVNQLTDLHKKCFPADEMPVFTQGYWWIAYDNNEPVGFCGLTHVKSWDSAGYLSRGGVVATHRGKGLQRRMINVRVQKARKVGWNWLISATRENVPSSNNLIACGFKLYTPAFEWLDGHSLYWIRKIA